MISTTLKIQGMKAVNDPARIMLHLARQPIGGGTPEMTIEVFKESELGRLPMGASVSARFTDATKTYLRTTQTRIVRFERSYKDDAQYIAQGEEPAAAYMKQLVAELAEGSLHRADECELKFADLSDVGDTYWLYVAVKVIEPIESKTEMAARLQEVYDDGAVAGLFQIIG